MLTHEKLLGVHSTCILIVLQFTPVFNLFALPREMKHADICRKTKENGKRKTIRQKRAFSLIAPDVCFCVTVKTVAIWEQNDCLTASK